VSTDTNCRTGPAAAYGYKTTVNPGQTLEVVGVHAQGSDYVIVDYGNGATCWLWLRYADKTDFSAYDLPAFNTPATPTPTYTPTPSFDWNGSWTFWTSATTFATTFSVSGNSISGTIPSENVTFNGTISSNGQNVSGTWSDPGDAGTFQWQVKSGNLNQFVGSGTSGGGGTFEWCGTKNGASQPSPCKWP